LPGRGKFSGSSLSVNSSITLSDTASEIDPAATFSKIDEIVIAGNIAGKEFEFI
jgi:hypothetical protein